MSAACSFFLICPFKRTVLLNKGRHTALKDRDTALFTYFFKIDHHKDWGIPVSPPCRQLPLQCVRKCTCVSTDCSVGQSSSRHSNTYTYTSCRAGKSRCVFGSTSSHWQLEDVCTAVTGVRASACDVVPLWFIKNTELTEQTHSGWMSLINTCTHRHTRHDYLTFFFILSCQEDFSNEKQVHWGWLVTALC